MFLKKLFQLVPMDPLTEGLEKFNQGQLKPALALFSGLLENENPEVSKKARLYSCEAHLQLGDQAASTELEKAMEHYEAARDLQPAFADVQNRLGETYLRLGRLPAAEQSFQAALEINARYFAACLNLAHAQALRGNRMAAAQTLLFLENWCPPLYREEVRELVQVCFGDEPVDWDERFSQTRSLTPSPVEVARQAALKALQNGHPERALDLLDALVRENPKFPDLHHLRGLAQSDLGMTEEAIASFEQALSINPYFLRGRINLGITYLELQRLDEAEQQLRKALEVDPANSLASSALEEIAVARVGA